MSVNSSIGLLANYQTIKLECLTAGNFFGNFNNIYKYAYHQEYHDECCALPPSVIVLRSHVFTRLGY